MKLSYYLTSTTSLLMEGTGFILRIYSPAKTKLSPTTQISLTNEITSANVSLASVAAVCSRLRGGQRPRTNDRTTSCLSPCPSVCLSLSYSSLVHIYSSVSAVLCCRLLLSLSFVLCLLFSACFFFPLYAFLCVAIIHPPTPTQSTHSPTPTAKHTHAYTYRFGFW